MDKKTYRIPISTGIFDHYVQIGPALWLLHWCIDKTTVEWTNAEGMKLGRILGSKPITDEEISRDITGCSPKVVRKFRLRLVQGGYLIQRRTPYGHVLEVFKSKKKWKSAETDGKPQRELPERVTLPKKRFTQNVQENYPTGSRELPDRVITKKTEQDFTNTKQ